MNKKPLCRFFNLNLRHDGGFTLVELIVVIAILAILAGVAVPVYSGYVTKANKQADISLIGEAKDALTLYYYDHYGENVDGYIVLTPEGESCVAEGIGTEAMNAVFGAGWENTLSLKHDGWIKKVDGSTVNNWSSNNAASTVAGVINFAQAAAGVNETSTVISVLGEFLPGMTEELELYQNDENFTTIATNLMVKYVSEEMKAIQFKKDADGNPERDNKGNYIFVGANGEEVSGGSNFAVKYSLLYSMANDENSAQADREKAQQKLAELNAEMEQIVEDEKNNQSTDVSGRLNDAINDAFNNRQFNNQLTAYISSNGDDVLESIGSAMDVVSSIAKGNNSAESLGMADLYNEDMIRNAIDYYKIANAAGGVVIYIDENGNVDTLPKIS